MTLKFNRQYSPPAELAEPPAPEEDLRTLKEVLRAVEALARQGETPEELHRCLKIIHCGATFITPSFEPGLQIYRAVSAFTKPLYKSRVSYAPASFVKQNGRLNTANESIFYGSVGHFGHALYECRAKAGDRFAIGRWTTTRKLLINHMGYSNPEINARVSERPVEYWMIADNPNTRNGVLRAWASQIFTKHIAPGNEHFYNLSIALARLAMDPLEDVPSDVPSEISGILYPSISTNLMGNNLALRPQAVDSCLELCEVQLVAVRLIDRLKDARAVAPLRIELDTIDAAISHRSDGRLIWLGESTASSVTPWA